MNSLKSNPPTGGKYKAIISDIDGTLTANYSNALPSKKVKDAIRKAQDKGLIFSVASARPYRRIEYLIKDLSLNSPIITNNGASVYDIKLGKNAWESPIGYKVSNQVLCFLKKSGRKFLIDSNYGHIDSAIPRINSKTKIFKFLIRGLSNKTSDELIKELEKSFKHLSFGKSSSWAGPNLFDVYITNENATKLHAVFEFAKILGISTTEIIAIGDHYNDFPLFMACGLKVAMGNAVEDLKAIADYVAPTIEEDGVADVVEKFVLN